MTIFNWRDWNLPEFNFSPEFIKLNILIIYATRVISITERTSLFNCSGLIKCSTHESLEGYKGETTLIPCLALHGWLSVLCQLRALILWGTQIQVLGICAKVPVFVGDIQHSVGLLKPLIGFLRAKTVNNQFIIWVKFQVIVDLA